MKKKEQLQCFFNKYYLDIRSLSLMRIGIALIALIDLIIRFTDVTAHYTEDGILPLSLLNHHLWNVNWFSIYNFASSTFGVSLLMAVHCVSIVMLLIGYKTRVFTLITWVFTVSIQNRNPLLGQGGDDLLRIILLYGIFLPWGTYFSIDSKLNKFVKPTQFIGLSGFGYLLLIFSMYFFSALLKNGSDWLTDYQALYYVLNLDMVTYSHSKFLLNYPVLCKALTLSVYFFELLAPFLLLIPFGISCLRWIFILSTGLLHLCIGCLLFVGLFPLISTVCLIGLLPASIWKNEEVIERLSSTPVFLKSIKNIFLGWVLLFSIYINCFHHSSYYLEPAEKLRPIAEFFRIDQYWGMFAPIVFRDDGWFIFKSEINNSEIDLNNNGQKLNYTKPKSIVSQVKNDRWRKYQEQILFIQNAYLRSKYCEWILKEWNNSHPKSMKLSKLTLIYMKEKTKPYPQKLTVEKVILHEY